MKHLFYYGEISAGNFVCDFLFKKYILSIRQTLEDHISKSVTQLFMPFSQVERGGKELSIREKIVKNGFIDLEIRNNKDRIFPRKSPFSKSRECV